MFVSFEGIDGCGKSTQARRLADALRARGHDVVATREPGGAPGAEEIRRLLVEGAPARWSPEAEVLLFNAARRDHLEHTIRPALDRGAVVVCDRFADSTRVYQGAARADLRPLVDQLHALVIGVEPDLTFVLDMPVGAALARGMARQSAETRFEALGEDFQTTLRAGFRELAGAAPGRIRLVDAARPVGAVAADVLAQTEAALA